MATQEVKDLTARVDALEQRILALEHPAPIPAPPPHAPDPGVAEAAAPKTPKRTKKSKAGG